MCGIAGQLGGTDRRVPQMIAALTHRGPDGIRIEDARPGTVVSIDRA